MFFLATTLTAAHAQGKLFPDPFTAQEHEVVALKGNHDIFPNLFLKDPAILSDWRKFGGVETLISYGLRPSFRMEKDDLRQLADDFAAAFPIAHADFFNALSPSFSCGDFFFVHAGVKPGTPLDHRAKTTSCGSDKSSSTTKAISESS